MAAGGLGWGATNSGKSYSIASHFGRRCAAAPARHLLIGANLKLLRGECIPLIRRIAREYGVGSTNYRTDVGTFTVGPSLVIVAAGDKDGDEERLRSYHNLDSIMAEEVTRMKPDFFDMALTRQRQPPGPVWASCNPHAPDNWVKRRLDEGWWPHAAMFLMSDNPTLTDEQRGNFESRFHGVFRMRMIEALWAAPEGLIFPWSMDTDYWGDGQPCVIGCDWGESGTTAVAYAQQTGGVVMRTGGLTEPVWAQVGEYYHVGYTQGQRNADQHVAEIKRRAPGKIIAAYVDPSAVVLKDALMRAGVMVHNGYNDVERGLDTCDGMLQGGTLVVNKGRCTATMIEQNSYIWNKYGDKPDPNCADHIMDARRYLACALSQVRGATGW